ncbi:hypothetical protein MTTB_p350 (plasmid) [Methanothermobacter tenebrarum]|uniref:Uncharacterized protein n=1 Tax=Methanothermobacter tenebrarum TaxID=680118 RepID=A0ABN6PDE1_9EURY|nr:hypothetical protein MTTB_p350 [Methanothermobacter tenebrarum]
MGVHSRYKSKSVCMLPGAYNLQGHMVPCYKSKSVCTFHIISINFVSFMLQSKFSVSLDSICTFSLQVKIHSQIMRLTVKGYSLL